MADFLLHRECSLQSWPQQLHEVLAREPIGLSRATLGEAVWHCRIANIRGWDGAHLVSEGSFLELFVPVGPEEIRHLDLICRYIIGIAILQMLITKEGVVCIMIYTLL